jgi:hypothetical protein
MGYICKLFKPICEKLSRHYKPLQIVPSIMKPLFAGIIFDEPGLWREHAPRSTSRHRGWGRAQHFLHMCWVRSVKYQTQGLENSPGMRNKTKLSRFSLRVPRALGQVLKETCKQEAQNPGTPNCFIVNIGSLAWPIQLMSTHEALVYITSRA